VTTSATSSYSSGPCGLPLLGETIGRPGAAGGGGHRTRRRAPADPAVAPDPGTACGSGSGPAEHTVRAVCRDMEPIMEQVGDEEIRERLAGIVCRLRPGRGDRPPVLSRQPEPRNEEERA